MTTSTTRPAVDRVLSRVDFTSIDCWIFVGGLDHNGYGKVSVRRDDRSGWSVRGTHRVVYEALVGPVPDGLELDHLCRVRNCCNPDHLEPVVPRENTRRGVGPSSRNMVKTVCDMGHPLDLPNTYEWRGERHCRSCRREKDAARQSQRAAYARSWRRRNREHYNRQARDRRAARSAT